MLEPPLSFILETSLSLSFLISKIRKIIGVKREILGVNALRWTFILEYQKIAWDKVGQHFENKTAKIVIHLKY